MFESILNSSQYFHVVDGMIPDVMHDLLEGTLQLHIKMLLKHFIIEQALFSLDMLNTGICSFAYGPADTSNKPSIISDDTLASNSNSLKQSCKHISYVSKFYSILIAKNFSRELKGAVHKYCLSGSHLSICVTY